MPADPPSNAPFPSDLDALSQIVHRCESYSVDRLPIIAAFCHKLGISESVNTRVDSKADIDAGTVVVAMILDTLSGRTPLYRFHEFFEHQDTELLLGREIPAERFTDDVLGRALDRIHNVGTMKIFTAISLKACQIFGVRTDQGHFDTTSVNVWGAYANSTADGSAPHVTYGYSKDKRPDLKQFLFSLLCVEGNIPLLGKVENGNAADTKLNNGQLEQIAKLIAENKLDQDNFLYIADCKLVTEDNLKLIGDNPFITRLPASYKVHGEVIEAALAEDKWEEVGTLNVTPASVRRPAAIYKVAEREIALYGSSYRAIVVHSSNHDKRRQKRIDRQLEEARMKAEKAVKQAQREVFSCEKDAQAALEKLEKTFANGLWQAGGSLKSREVRASGKVAVGNERKVLRTEFGLSLGILENQELTERFRAQAGCFVLLSNAPAPAPEIATEIITEVTPEITPEIKSKVTTKEVTTGIKTEAEQVRPGQRLWSAPQCLQAYKEQHGVESNFSFLKEPLIVNDVFLKNPGRIDALGMIMLLSLLLWSLMQRTLRQSVEQQPELRLSDLDNKPTKRPTSFIMVHKFLSVIILKIGGHRRLSKPLRSDQLQYLRALGLDHTVFTTPPRKHMKPVPT